MTFRATFPQEISCLGVGGLCIYFSVVDSFLVYILYNVIHAFIVLTLNFSVKTVSKHSLLYPRQKKEREIIESFGVGIVYISRKLSVLYINCCVYISRKFKCSFIGLFRFVFRTT